jgi:hypothetical protein
MTPNSKPSAEAMKFKLPSALEAGGMSISETAALRSAPAEQKIALTEDVQERGATAAAAPRAQPPAAPASSAPIGRKGRPKGSKNAGRRKTNRVTLLFDDEEMKAVDIAAAKDLLSTPMACRRFVLQAINYQAKNDD